MFSIFKTKTKTYGTIKPLTVDMHSHLLPNIDDGVENYEQAVAVVQELAAQGYKKLITTPHIMSDFYRNTPEIILDKLDKLQNIIDTMGLDIELEAAAEYYLDEGFVRKLENQEKLLCFGKKRYVLFETSYINSSPYLEHVVFMMQSQGYTPVLAHPERYIYLFDDYEKLPELRRRGVHLQLNINSLVGYYSKAAQHIAERLIDDQLISFMGTDCHGIKHLKYLQNAKHRTYFRKALSGELLNNTL